MLRPLSVFSLLLAGCGPQYLITEDTLDDELSDSEGTETGATEEEVEEEDFSEYDLATLVIVEPSSGEYLPWQAINTFEAEVVDADGNVMDFDEITWMSDLDEDWLPVGAVFEDDTIGVGSHAITATAELPNGDRLAYTIGGVLIQSPYAGTYTGTTIVEITVSGYSAACSGALTAIIDQEGEVGQGDSNCYVSLQGFEIDLDFAYDLSNDLGYLTGDAALDIYGYEVPVDLEGELTEDGTLYGTFGYELSDYLSVGGEVEAVRISRDTEFEQ